MKVLRIVEPTEEVVDLVCGIVPCIMSERDLFVPSDCFAELKRFEVEYETVDIN